MNSLKIRFSVFVVLIVVSIILSQYFSIDQDKINKFLEGTPIIYASFIFVILYVVGTFLIWYLKDPLKVVGAVLFGAYLSTVLIYVAEIINAYIFFNISHLLGQEFVEKNLRGRFKKFYERLENVNLGWIFMLRVVPLIPYRVLDLSFGLSKVRFRKYLIAILLASLPRIFWIQFILASVRGFSIDAMMSYFMENNTIFLFSLIYFILTAIVAFKIKDRFAR